MDMPAEVNNKTELRRAIWELYYWQRLSDASNFTAILYTLISKADILNRAKLTMAFPYECVAYELWQESLDENEFFKNWLGDQTLRKRIP
jgi:hypothetical protein